MSPLQAEEIFVCLDRHRVRYVLIGGLAAVLQGSPLATFDVLRLNSIHLQALDRIVP